MDRYRNLHNYFDFPKTKFVPANELYNGNAMYKTVFVDQEYGEEKFKEFICLEQKHYDKFLKLLKQWHTGWWT